MAGLNKEIWVSRLERNTWFGNNAFMQDAVNMDAFVENDKINFAKKGTVITVTKNDTYPLDAPSTRTDTAGSATLDEYVTNQIVVSDATQVELAYNKLDSIVDEAKEEMEEAIAAIALHAIAPDDDTTLTPHIDVASGNATGSDGFKILKTADILKLKKAFDDLNYPKAGRVLVLNPDAIIGLIEETVLQEQYMRQAVGNVSGAVFNVYGFEIYERTYDLYYTTSDAKVAYGGTPGGTDNKACNAYIKNTTFLRALGSTHMYSDVDNPQYQGTIMSWRKRAKVAPFFQQYMGAIIRTKA